MPRSSLARQYLLAILLLPAASCPSWAQDDDPALRDRFLKGVAQIARKLDHLSFRGKCIHTTRLTAVSAKTRATFTDRKVAPDKIETKTFEVALRGAYGLETGILEKSGDVYFKVRNDSYAFGLGRSLGGERASLQFVEQLGVDPSIDARIEGLEETPRASALGAFYLWTDPLFRLVESDSFSIQRVYAVPSGANQLVRVEFEYLVDEPARRIKHRVSDGFLVCDPAREWVLTEYGGTRHNFINKYTLKQKAVLECGETIGGIPIATKIVRTSYSPDDPDTKRESVSTIEVTGRDVPREEFYLRHYGLPEPNFGGSWFGTWVWYLIGGIGCIVIGAIIIKWRQTRR